MHKIGLMLIVAAGLSACEMTSDVMDAGGGTYMISAHASAVRGGATGANEAAYEDAQKYCATSQPGTHAIVVDQNERDVYNSSVGGSWNGSGGSFGGGRFAAGNADLRFRCGA